MATDAILENLVVSEFYRTTLTTDAVSGDSTVVVSDASGFPTIPVGKYFYLTLVDDSNQVLVLPIESISSNTLTILDNGVDDPVIPIGYSFTIANSRAEHWFTAEAFRDVQAAIEDFGASNYPGYDDVTIYLSGGLLAVKPGGILSTHIGDDQVVRAKIGPNAVGEDELADDTVTSNMLKTNAVTTLKITDESVTNAKLAPGAIGFDKLPQVGYQRVLGNLVTDPLRDIDEVPVDDPTQMGGTGFAMGGGVGNTNTVMATQLAIWNFVKDEIKKYDLGTFLDSGTIGLPVKRVLQQKRIEFVGDQGQQTVKTSAGIGSAITYANTSALLTDGAAYTPLRADSRIVVEADINLSYYNDEFYFLFGLFRDQVSPALDTFWSYVPPNTASEFEIHQIHMVGEFTPGTLDTFALYFRGAAEGPSNFVRTNDRRTGGGWYGNALKSTFTITEYQP
jgi:hypothetical protein